MSYIATICEFFSKNKIEVMVWPPSSLDLNPIEKKYRKSNKS